MEQDHVWKNRFYLFFLNNKIVLFLLIVLLIGINILVFNKVSYIFTPLTIILKTIVLPIILSGILYYLLNPLVNQMEKWRVSRGWGILLIYLAIVVVLTLIVLKIIPILQNQLTGLINNLPNFGNQIQSQIEEWINSPFFSQFQLLVNLNLDDWWSALTEKTGDFLTSIFMGITGIMGTLATFLEKILSIITVPFILFYLLKDGKKLPNKILSIFPVKIRSNIMHVLTEMNYQISSFIRGQITISFCIGALLYIGYIIIGLDYPLVLAIVASLTNVVPYLGPAIAIIPAMIVALVTSPVMLLKMVIVWTLVQLIEGKLISPQIMGKTLNIHPITIIFVILTSGNLFGVVGVLLAVPGYALLKIWVVNIFNWFKVRSGLYELNDKTIV